MKKILISLLSIFATLCANAEIKMPKLFSDNAILQRDVPVNVWGWAEPNAKVELKFAGQVKTVKANKNGAWRVVLDPMQASSQSRSIFVSENEGKTVEIKNVVVGEVWISGGQSNMEFALRSMNGSKEFIENAKNYDVRFFMQKSSMESKTPMLDAGNDAHWVDFRGDSNKIVNTSAIATVFACKLNAKIKIPVGVVDTSLSGTNMYSWLPKDVFENDPTLEHERKNLRDRTKRYDYQKALSKWQKGVDEYEVSVAKAKAEGKPAPKRHYRTTVRFRPRADSPDLYRTQGELYNGKVFPVKDYAARAFLWYQGENDGTMKNGFRESFVAIMKSWRASWGNANMPFVAIQLPSFGTKSHWAEIRAQQSQACEIAKNAYPVVTIDTGEKDDIHPKDKLEIAYRAANVALKMVYGFNDIVAFAPSVKNVSFENQTATVYFNRKIECRGEVRGFEVLSEGKWIPAKAKVQARSVTLTTEGKANIEGVRYLWKSWAKPDVCIYGDNLPVSPFIKEK